MLLNSIIHNTFGAFPPLPVQLGGSECQSPFQHSFSRGLGLIPSWHRFWPKRCFAEGMCWTALLMWEHSSKKRGVWCYMVLHV